MTTRFIVPLVALGLIVLPALAQAQGSATGGTAGSAAAGGTSASTVGTGGTSTGANGPWTVRTSTRPATAG
jgi:hypothetical protein